MRCRNCGAQINPNGLYCTECGEPIGTQASAAHLDDTRVLPSHSTAPRPIVPEPDETRAYARTSGYAAGNVEAPLPVVPGPRDVRSSWDVREVREARGMRLAEPELEQPRSPLVPILAGICALLLLIIVGFVVVNPDAVGLGSLLGHGATEATSAQADQTADSGAAATPGGDVAASDGGGSASVEGTATIEEVPAEADEPAAEDDSVPAEDEKADSEDDSKPSLTQTSTPVFPTADASSSLAPDQYASYYGPLNAIDGDQSTAWNEGASGSGVGEWIRLNASTPQVIKGVRVLAGFPKSKVVYYANNRPRDVTITLSDGYSTSVTLADTVGAWQTITFDELHETSYVTITINSVYEGNTWQDLAIGEIEVI